VVRLRFTLPAGIVVLLALAAGNAMARAPLGTSPGPTGGAYARVKNGETRQRIVTLLGRNFTICTTCAPLTWVYRTGLSDPIAIVVRFTHGTVASHFLVRPQTDL
jgi:hypothetical protein